MKMKNLHIFLQEADILCVNQPDSPEEIFSLETKAEGENSAKFVILKIYYCLRIRNPMKLLLLF